MAVASIFNRVVNIGLKNDVIPVIMIAEIKITGAEKLS
jgi:hypothetical protein